MDQQSGGAVPNAFPHCDPLDALARTPEGDEMSEWQPIETAPKDGTRVLLRLRYYHPPEPDKIWADIGSWRPDYLDDNQMWRDDFGDAIESERGSGSVSVTGWMSLEDLAKLPDFSGSPRVPHDLDSTP